MLSFETSRLMAVIFTPNFIISDKLVLANKFKEISENKFDGELISLPVPPNAPPGLPRLTLISHDGIWKIEVSLERTNLIFNRPLGITSEIPSIYDFGNFADQFFCAYKKYDNINIQRLALVSETFSILKEETPAHFIASKFLKNENFLNSNTLEIHSHKRYKIDSFNINSWIHFKTANLANKERTPILLFENDINTLPENKDTNFSESEIKKYFVTIPKHFNEISTLFF